MSYPAKITESGEILLPAALQREFDLRPGDRLIVEREGDKFVLKSYFQVVEEASLAIRTSLEAPFTVADFIADRRAEAAKERALSSTRRRCWRSSSTSRAKKS